MNRKTLQLYWRHVRNHKQTFYTMLLAIPIGATIIDSILPYFLSQAIGQLGDPSANITRLLVFSAIAGLVGAALNYVGFQAMVIHESYMLRELRESTFETLIHKDNAFFSNQKIGAMTSRYIDFVRAYVTIQDLFIIRTLSFILAVGTGLVLLSIESLVVAGCVALLIILLVIQIRWSAKHRAPLRHERKELVGTIHGHVADALTNNLIVRSFAQEREEAATLRTMSNRFSTVYRKDIGFVTTEGSIRVLLMIIIQTIAIVLSVTMIEHGTMSVAAAIFVLAYMQRIGSQLFALSDIINGYDQAFLDAQPMTEMLLSQNSVPETKNHSNISLTKPVINFDTISYHYPDGDELVINDISLTIPAGQKVGLVGSSGAGKSTIVQLLLRFSDVTGGTIQIDGHALPDIPQRTLRKFIAYVPQEPMLFHRTLRENIAYGNEGTSDADIISAAKKAHAWEFIQKMPNGLDTTVGERGVKLSGGQRQRIAIARAILKDAPILVLDEATSALDSESERLIQASLASLMKGRTSIVIAHRLSTIAKLDRIIVLDGGRIVEDGSHQQLLDRGGLYAKLWSHQSGGFIEE